MTSSTTAFLRAVRTELEAHADADVRAGSERYFVHATRFIGVKAPATYAVGRACLALLDKDVDVRRAAALSLLRSPFMEERQIGVRVLSTVAKRVDAGALVDELAQLFDEHVHEWATCDGLCSKVLRKLLERDAVRTRLRAWAKASSSPWRQRAAAVAFVNEARFGRYDDDVIAVCGDAVQNPHRFVQLGVGWALRELSLADRPRVLAFILARAAALSREGLRYATEKLPADERKRIHDRHLALSKLAKPTRQRAATSSTTPTTTKKKNAKAKKKPKKAQPKPTKRSATRPARRA